VAGLEVLTVDIEPVQQRLGFVYRSPL